MKTVRFALGTPILLFSTLAYAQAEGEGFFDTYLPIAKIFASPWFIGPVMGSAILLILGTWIFVKYSNHLEEKAKKWGANKTTEEIIKLLDSPMDQEKQYAFIYLRRHGDETIAKQLTETLQKKRKEGKLDPRYIYLLEELRGEKAIPVLQQIAKGKSQLAVIAEHAIERLTEQQEEKEEAEAKTS